MSTGRLVMGKQIFEALISHGCVIHAVMGVGNAHCGCFCAIGLTKTGECQIQPQILACDCGRLLVGKAKMKLILCACVFEVEADAARIMCD